MNLVLGPFRQDALKVDADVDVEDTRFDADGHLTGVVWGYWPDLKRGN